MDLAGDLHGPPQPSISLRPTCRPDTALCDSPGDPVASAASTSPAGWRQCCQCTPYLSGSGITGGVVTEHAHDRPSLIGACALRCCRQCPAKQQFADKRQHACGPLLECPRRDGRKQCGMRCDRSGRSMAVEARAGRPSSPSQWSQRTPQPWPQDPIACAIRTTLGQTVSVRGRPLR